MEEFNAKVIHGASNAASKVKEKVSETAVKSGITWENIQPLVWVVVCAALSYLPVEGDVKTYLIGACLTRIRVKL